MASVDDNSDKITFSSVSSTMRRLLMSSRDDLGFKITFYYILLIYATNVPCAITDFGGLIHYAITGMECPGSVCVLSLHRVISRSSRKNGNLSIDD